MPGNKPLSVYIRRSDRRVAPFQDPPGQTRILNRSLLEHQQEVCAACGLPPPIEIDSVDDVREFPCLLFADYTYFTRTLLEEFLRGARRRSGGARCAIAPSVFVETTRSLQDLDGCGVDNKGAAYDLWYLTEPVTALAALRSVEPLSLDPRELVRNTEPPAQFVNRHSDRRISFTSRQVMHLTHWVLVWRANLSAFAGMVKDRWERHPVRTVLRLLLDRTFGRFRRVRLSHLGRGCRIHPSAVVEGSWLGDGVRIGAGAIVRGSLLGSGARVDDGAQVHYSILGRRTWIAGNTVVLMMVMYDDVFSSHQLTQAGLFGHRACTSTGGFLIDTNFRGAVKVMKDGVMVGSGTNFLGSCLGHDVVLGTGIWIQAGREVPNGAFLIRDPADVVHTVPAVVEPGTVLVARNGGLEPLK